MEKQSCNQVKQASMQSSLKYVITVSFLLLTIISCKQEQKPLETIGWLQGTWVSQTQRGPLYEDWLKTGDSGYAVKSFYLFQTDTVYFEKVAVTEAHNKIHYTVRVAADTKQEPVDFVSIALDSDSMVLENKRNPFPQQIIYRKKGTDSLVAEITGLMAGRKVSEFFPMKKIR